MSSHDQAELIIGMMSGTSMDGIDAALVEFESISKLRLIETEFTPFSNDLRDEIKNVALNSKSLFKNNDSPLHQELAQYYVQASLSLLNKAGITQQQKKTIRAIANHGQTVRHEPNATQPFSLQLGDGQLIANQTGIQTITQFRQADLAAGGQGAPLMPAFHNAIFTQSENGASLEQDRFILNLGGIANITRLGSRVIGFDTGPSNCLLDQWIQRHRSENFDRGGEWAASGEVINKVLGALMDDPFLNKPYPKSTGTDYYNLAWLESRIPYLDKYEPRDIQSTLLAFTVETIKLALDQLSIQKGSVFVCGGGAQNPILLEAIRQRLAGFDVDKTDELGVPADWVEAIGFAWLGYCNLHNIPSNLPSVTGASQKVVLGQRYQQRSG